MSFLIIFGLLLMTIIFAPRLANTLAWLVVLAFIIPFFTFVGGALIWSIISMCSSVTYFSRYGLLYCCTLIGLPLGVVAAYLSLKLRPQ